MEESLALSSNTGARGISDLQISIVQPYQFDLFTESYPNQHMVDIGNCSWTPFTSQWNITIQGSMSLALSSAMADPLVELLNGSSIKEKKELFSFHP